MRLIGSFRENGLMENLFEFKSGPFKGFERRLLIKDYQALLECLWTAKQPDFKSAELKLLSGESV